MAGSNLELKIEYKEISELAKKFQEIQNKVVSFRTGLTDRFTKVLTDDIRKRFLSSPSTTSGGRVHGDVYWRALSDSYLASNPERAQGVVLVDTGALRDSFQMQSPNLVSEFSNQYSFRFGTRIKYAEKLQKTWPIVFFTPEVLQELAKVYAEWLIEDFE